MPNYEIILKFINQIIDKKLDNDINNGVHLLEQCNFYHNSCNSDLQKQVYEFINYIIHDYNLVINFINSINGNINTNSSSNNITCSSLSLYVDMLKMIKEAKKKCDNYEDLIKMFRGENNE